MTESEYNGWPRQASSRLKATGRLRNEEVALNDDAAWVATGRFVPIDEHCTMRLIDIQKYGIARAFCDREQGGWLNHGRSREA